MRFNNPNAYLSYTKPASGNNAAQKVSQMLWVDEYSQTHSLSGETHQSQYYQHFYARSYAPGAVEVKGRVPTQAEYNKLTEFIRQHHLDLLANRGFYNAVGDEQLPLLNFGIPSENFYVRGWITPFEGGAKRFNPAPPFTFQFFPVADRHSSNDKIVPSHALKHWWTGEVIEGSTSSSALNDAVEADNGLIPGPK